MDSGAAVMVEVREVAMVEVAMVVVMGAGAMGAAMEVVVTVEATVAVEMAVD